MGVEIVFKLEPDVLGLEEAEFGVELVTTVFNGLEEVLGGVEDGVLGDSDCWDGGCWDLDEEEVELEFDKGLADQVGW